MAFFSLGKRKSRDAKVVDRALIIGDIAKETTLICLMSMATKLLKTSRETLWKHKKIKVQLDDDDEIACWAIICRYPY